MDELLSVLLLVGVLAFRKKKAPADGGAYTTDEAPKFKSGPGSQPPPTPPTVTYRDPKRVEVRPVIQRTEPTPKRSEVRKVQSNDPGDPADPGEHSGGPPGSPDVPDSGHGDPSQMVCIWRMVSSDNGGGFVNAQLQRVCYWPDGTLAPTPP